MVSKSLYSDVEFLVFWFNYMQLLLGKEISTKLKIQIKDKVSQIFGDKPVYLAVIFLWDNSSSKTYVTLKKKYWEDVWIRVEIFGQSDDIEVDDPVLKLYKKENYDNSAKIIELIHYLNYDSKCIWIIVQLPLPDQFLSDKEKILATISPAKDVDWLAWVVNWLSEIWLIDFVPATPRAVFVLLDNYWLGNLKWKSVAVIWQSNLVGKPLVMESIKRWASVSSFNEFTDSDLVQQICKKSDYIFSCTGQVHLVNQNYVWENKNQIIVDVGYGHKDGKAVGDVDFESISDKVAYITPVPGWVGPITVACIFDNIFVLQKNKNQLKTKS